MKVTTRVTLTDGTTHTAEAGFQEIIKLEREFGMDASDLAQRQRAEWLAFLAWCALRRQEVPGVADTFAGFVDQIADLEPVETEQGNDRRESSGS